MIRRRHSIIAAAALAVPTLAFAQEMEGHFGNDDVLIVALKPDASAGFGLDFFLRLQALTQALESELPGVEQVASLMTIPRISGTCLGETYFHLESIGSVCRSVLAEHRRGLECLEIAAAKQSDEPAASARGVEGSCQIQPLPVG